MKNPLLDIDNTSDKSMEELTLPSRTVTGGIDQGF